MSRFKSLLDAIEASSRLPVEALPEQLRHDVVEAFFPLNWDDLSPEQRRSVAQQWDWQHDPAFEAESEYWFELECRKDALQEQYNLLQAFDGTSPREMVERDEQLARLEKQLALMEIQANQAERVYQKKRSDDKSGPEIGTEQVYIPYPKAFKVLAERLFATVDEMAAWVWLGPDENGLAAYLNANEISPPPRFYYSLGAEGDFDYHTPLMSCWFSEADILNFEPADRYVRGKDLIERWVDQPGIQPESYIRAKIKESRLIDIHPLFGATQGSFPGDDLYPPIESGLFSLSMVEEIEADDFLAAIERRQAEAPDQRKKRLQRWHDDEVRLRGKYGALNRTAKREGISRQTLSAILKRQEQNDATPAISVAKLKKQ